MMPKLKKKSVEQKVREARNRARRMRENESTRVTINSTNAASHRLARLDPKIRNQEQEKNTAAHRVARLDPERRNEEQETDTIAHRLARLDPEWRNEEREADTIAHRVARLDPEQRNEEQDRNTTSRHIARLNSLRRKSENENRAVAQKKKRSEEVPTYDDIFKKYKEKIKGSPSFVCSCCGGLWYKESTTTTSEAELEKKGLPNEIVADILFVNQEIHRLCTTCKSNIAKGLKHQLVKDILFGDEKIERLCASCTTTVSTQVVPRMALSNGFDFPNVAVELKDMSPLEERLVALRIPFMTIRLLGCERQSSLRGNVVNVENDLSISTQVLPRKFDETSTIQVQLMRRMQYKSPYMYETIRPLKVYRAAKFLLNTDLYRNENILLSEDWSRYREDETLHFVCCENEDLDDIVPEQEMDIEGSPELAEEAEAIGSVETLIYSEKSTAEFCGLRIAPGEGKTPIALHLDPMAEILSFPTIYGGRDREIKLGVKASYTDIAKSELRRYDRRACIPSKILYSFKRSFNEKVVQAIQVCMRKKKGGSSTTAGTALSPDFIPTLLEHDEGYPIFKKLRTSPSYWKEKTKKVLAMVRQLGKPAFFITLSAAETKWTELIVMLYKILKQEDITEDEAGKLSYDQVAELIRSDPVTCMRHFDHRYRALLNVLLKPSAGLFSPYLLQDQFSRVEFQMRGSPHSHGLYWIKDAPIYNEQDEDSIKLCTEFINEFVTCKRDEEGEMSRLIGYQIHKHSHTCTKKTGPSGKCRFGYPKPPMEETAILTPLPSDTDSIIKKAGTELYSKIHYKLEEFGRQFNENIPFDDFLDFLGTTQTEYILAVRASIKRTTVFLKRQTSEIFVNGYNRKLLVAWGANIDFQFIIDSYACAKYCVGYILKSEGGVSKLLQAATQDIRKGNLSVKDKLKQFAKILITGSEISAQEAVAFLLGIPNTCCSRQDIFINTAPPDERIYMLKSKQELELLPAESDDIYSKGLVDHYVQRPQELNDTCLADFASMYDFSKTKTFAPIIIHDDIEHEDQNLPEGKFQLLDKTGFVKKRKVRKVIRYRHYGKHDEPEHYYRELLMLFVPWRSEETELLTTDSIQKAEQLRDSIILNSKPFIHDFEIDDIQLLNLVEEVETEDNLQNEPLIDDDIEAALHCPEFDGMDTSHEGAATGIKVQQFLPPKLIDQASYDHLMRSLNDKQRRYVLNVLYLFKTSSTPFYNFLSGGAGVGKSHAINAVVQSYLRVAAKQVSISPEQVCVIVSAPTGKAAFNVFGMTLHCTFKLPPNQYGGKLCDLDHSAVNSLRTKLAKTILFIIDEISMVSVKQLYDIDHRLRQIFGSVEDFGGKSVLVVGHLRQLPPIAGSYVFKEPKHLPLGEIAGNHLWEKFSLFELDEIMRQRGEYEFCKALNNMSEGCMDEDDIALLKAREISVTGPPPKESIWLFQTNDECRDKNNEVHQTLNTEGITSTAYDKIQGSGTDTQKHRLLDYAKTLKPQQTDGLPYETHLQINGEYFVSTNVDVEEGLFNGATGCLKLIEYGVVGNTNARIPTRVWMDFRNPIVGYKTKAKTREYQLKKGIPLELVAIERQTKNLSKSGRHHGLQIIRNQIPLVGANGMTIPKAQGSSIVNVVLNVKQSKGRQLTREQLYTGCSRATSRNGLFIDGSFKAPTLPGPNDPVTIEMSRLRNNPYNFALKFLQDYDDSFQKLYFHNVQSYYAHHLDVKADQCCMASNFIALVEPHLLETDVLVVPDEFTCIHRTNCQKIRNSEGALVFSKIGQDVAVANARYYSNNAHCVFVSWKISDVNILMVYKSPKYPSRQFQEHLSDKLKGFVGKILLFGDVNTNLMSADNSLVVVFRNFNLSTRLNLQLPSTDGGTHIDCCFSNFELDAWFYESYYSYHKPICIVFKV